MQHGLELARVIPEDTLGAALARVLGLARDEVAVGFGWEAVGEGRVTCVYRTRPRGEFPFNIEIVLPDALMPEARAFDRALCRELGCRALVSDDSLNPYTWILVTPEGGLTAVSVRTDSEDLIVAREREVILDPDRQALEQAIEMEQARGDDVAPYLVLADLLIARGDPFGEHIALACAAERDPSLRAAYRQHFERKIDATLYPWYDRWGHAGFTWRRGFVVEAVLSSTSSERTGEPEERLQGFLGHPCARFLRRLEIEDPTPEVVAVLLAARPRPPLGRLALGQDPRLDDAQHLREAFPGL